MVGKIDQHGGTGQKQKDSETENECRGGHDELFDGGMHDRFNRSIGVRGEVGILIRRQPTTADIKNRRQTERQRGTNRLKSATALGEGNVSGGIVLEKSLEDAV